PTDARGIPLIARNSVHHDPLHASRLDFQVLPDDSDGDNLLDVWEVDHFGGLRRDGSTDFDGDGFSDGQEYFAGTRPTDAASLLRIEQVRFLSPTLLEISWQSVADRRYDLLGAAGGLTGPFATLATNIVGTPLLTTLQVPIPTNQTIFFRVRTQKSPGQ
ncbi:MAG: thrombospondin type 3 repeat-containing protein, partial [Verrucomicrobiales bacterium]|nr:thrombospondin type 3 repeat-containing protein [Verrucomicrobiales bacterium]